MAKLLGNRIYLEIPKKEESKLIVDSNTKEALEKEMIIKMSKLKVHTVGTAIMDENIIVGAIVLVDPAALKTAKVIPLSEDESVILVSHFDIIQVW
jgi:hypothetical protein